MVAPNLEFVDCGNLRTLGRNFAADSEKIMTLEKASDLVAMAYKYGGNSEKLKEFLKWVEFFDLKEEKRLRLFAQLCGYETVNNVTNS